MGRAEMESGRYRGCATTESQGGSLRSTEGQLTTPGKKLVLLLLLKVHLDKACGTGGMINATSSEVQWLTCIAQPRRRSDC